MMMDEYLIMKLNLKDYNEKKLYPVDCFSRGNLILAKEKGWLDEYEIVDSPEDAIAVIDVMTDKDIEKQYKILYPLHVKLDLNSRDFNDEDMLYIAYEHCLEYLKKEIKAFDDNMINPESKYDVEVSENVWEKLCCNDDKLYQFTFDSNVPFNDYISGIFTAPDSLNNIMPFDLPCQIICKSWKTNYHVKLSLWCNIQMTNMETSTVNKWYKALNGLTTNINDELNDESLSEEDLLTRYMFIKKELEDFVLESFKRYLSYYTDVNIMDKDEYDKKKYIISHYLIEPEDKYFRINQSIQLNKYLCEESSNYRILYNTIKALFIPFDSYFFKSKLIEKIDDLFSNSIYGYKDKQHLLQIESTILSTLTAMHIIDEEYVVEKNKTCIGTICKRGKLYDIIDNNLFEYCFLFYYYYNNYVSEPLGEYWEGMNDAVRGYLISQGLFKYRFHLNDFKFMEAYVQYLIDNNLCNDFLEVFDLEDTMNHIMWDVALSRVEFWIPEEKAKQKTKK